ncbi:MAG: HDIG domain-containing protein [Planctomycetes bacterium]|nr:HDIG domain-containing protein [Planctomycetota bacterium]
MNKDGLKDRLLDALTSADTALGILVILGFVTLCSLVVIWGREQPLVAVGRIMDDTRLVRVSLSLEDDTQTQRAKEAARQATPRVYVADMQVIGAVVQSIENLPRALASAANIEAVDPTIRKQFALTEEMLQAVKMEVAEGEPTGAWVSKTHQLTALLKKRPLLDQQTYQKSVQEGAHQMVKLVYSSEESVQVFRGELVNVGDKALAEVMNILARDAGFTGPTRELVSARLAAEAKPTFTFDAAATTKAQNAAADAVEPIRVQSAVGQVIYQRGEALTQPQADLFRAELAHYRSHSEFWQRWLYIGGVVAAVAAITAALAGYTVLFCPRIRNKVSRMVGVAGILLLGICAACFSGAALPQFMAVSSVVPTVFVAMLVTIAYDRRSALAFGLLHGMLVCIALRCDTRTLAVMIAGISCVVWTLGTIRDRNSIFRTSTFAAVGIAAAIAVFSLIERPLVQGVVMEIVKDASIAAAGTMVAGGVALFVLPMLERAFNVTTGLTLMELRDPKQPLLRELQQRAPGTYTHSLNVASIAEAAADAIGADGLLTYVGALYHDVGKMNKPEYFVENQTPGINKHDRLSPAMSLLVIVGHVKDGMELAREFHIPRNLQHFIEAHHGTTLVEFFFHRARSLAKAAAPASARRDAEEQEPDDVYLPDEFEYRYPGPKPRTKECAILMVSDAVESAARSLVDPTPSRVEALVRSIAHRRLMDGQFDDCDLTLRELNLIVESVTRSLSSVFHTRVAYPEPAAAAGA